MSSRHWISLAALAGMAVATTSAWAAGPQKGLVPGFLDAKTGVFMTQVGSAPAGEIDPQALTTYTGTLSLKINITLKSSVPADWPIHCTQTATFLDVGGVLNYNSSKTVLATRSGSTATCTVNINYAWQFNGANSMIYTNYMVNTLGTSTVLEQIEALGNMSPITLPASGQTTARTVSVTL